MPVCCLQGTFAAANTSAWPAVAASATAVTTGVVVGDFNGDGNLDLYFANEGSPGVVLLNHGPAVFRPGQSGVATVAARTFAAAACDFNGDDLTDLAIMNNGAENHVLLSDGTGNFVALPTSEPTEIGDADTQSAV